jgi:hypothetical protein
LLAARRNPWDRARDRTRGIKAAAALLDKSASFVLEEAAKDWLDRLQTGEK